MSANNRGDHEVAVSRETGRVKWFNKTRGYGFVVRNDKSELFIHAKDVRRVNGIPIIIIEAAMYVEFVESHGAKGLYAGDVTAGSKSEALPDT